MSIPGTGMQQLIGTLNQNQASGSAKIQNDLIR